MAVTFHYYFRVQSHYNTNPTGIIKQRYSHIHESASNSLYIYDISGQIITSDVYFKYVRLNDTITNGGKGTFRIVTDRKLF